MKYCYWIIILLLASMVFGETLQTVDFEGVTPSGYTISDQPNPVTVDDYWDRTDGTLINPTDPFTNKEGTYFFYGEDTDNGRTADEPIYVTLDAVNVTGYTGLQVRLLIAGNNNTGNGYEGTEYLRVQYAFDGGGFTTVAQYITIGGVSQTHLTEDADADGIADGVNLSPSFTEFTYSIPGTGSSLQIRMMANINSGSEEVGFDNIRVQGDYTLPVSLFSFSAKQNDDTVILQWATESESNNLGFILERKTVSSDWQEIASYRTFDELTGQGNTSSRTEYEFTDNRVTIGQTYQYRLSDMDVTGKITQNNIIDVTVNDAMIPMNTALLPAYPNPFNPTTKISYDLAVDSKVSIHVYNMIGQEMSVLFNGIQTAGSHSITWAAGHLPAGVYLVRLKTPEFTQTQKCILLK